MSSECVQCHMIISRITIFHLKLLLKAKTRICYVLRNVIVVKLLIHWPLSLFHLYLVQALDRNQLVHIPPAMGPKLVILFCFFIDVGLFAA